MEKIIISPSKYVQGAGVLKKLPEFLNRMGDNVLIICDDFVMNLVKEDINSAYKNEKSKAEFEKFNGECSREEINRIIEIIKEKNINCITGVGGGKTLDTAKAAAFYTKIPVAVVPTIASTDAPCSALSVIYTPEGVFSEYLMFPKNPDIVIMDTKIIASAPVRLLLSGMGDALATYFEARACQRAEAVSMAGGTSTKAALALAELCYKTLLEDGYSAKTAAENKVVTKALENIIEANTYLSGIGFESSGLAAAHAIHNGLTVIEELHHLYHGEKGVFGTLTQLILENAPQEEINTVLAFCKKVGLPVCLKDMGLKTINHEKMYEAAEAACAEGETIHNMPFAVTPYDVYAAMLTADKMGEEFKG